MATGKRGRPAKNDLSGKTYTMDGEDYTVTVKSGSVLKDPNGDVILWEGGGTYFNPWSGDEEKLPPGKRGPVFRLLFEVDGEAKELRFDATRKIEAAERRAKLKG